MEGYSNGYGRSLRATADRAVQEGVKHREKREPGSEFGRALRLMRRRRGLNQSRLFGLTGVDRTMISRMESGQRWPSRDTVEDLAQGMDLEGYERAALLGLAGYTEAGPR